MALEGRQSLLGQIDGAPGGVFGLGEDEPAGDAPILVPPRPLKLAVHAQRRPLEVYVRPLQAQSLADAEPCSEGENVQSLQPVVGRGGSAEEGARLLGVERFYLLLPDRRRIHDCCRVTGDEVPPHRLLEARGYEERPLAFKWNEKFCYVAANVSEVEPDAVRSLRCSIEEDEPGWVESVKRQWPAYRPNVESTAYWAGVPLQATVAILLNLYERGELNVEDN